MPDWSIKIIRPKGQQLAQFVPDIDGAEPGDPLEVEQGDLVSWNNMDDCEHWPVPVDASPPYQLTAAAIQPDSSSPWFNVTFPAGTTISYCCEFHQEERGQLVVVPFGHRPKRPAA